MTLIEFAKSVKLTVPVPAQCKVTDRWTEITLYRDPPWQVQLIIVYPHVQVPPHFHQRVQSVDILLSGGGLANIGNREFNGILAGKRFLKVPVGKAHSGHAGENGSVYLSYQKWDGEPSFISEDWHEV